MNIWKELVKTALLGTERGSLSEEAQKLLSQQGIDIESSPEQQILEGVALYSQLKKAAFKLDESAVDIQPVAKEDENFCSPKAARFLTQILEGTYDKALKEFIWYCQKSKKILNPESLPELFYQSLSNPDLWQHIRPLIGQRGKWLLSLNPDWQPLAYSKKVENWPYADKKERLAILRHLRTEQPEQAIKLLESTWAAESPTHKQAFLKTLEIN